MKPTISADIEGKKKIMAYIQRPFDLNIVLLKNFFADFGDFNKIFPYECKDNYKIICRLLEIKPPKSLRKAYAKNPYAIIWYMIFKQLGVKDINFMQKFFLINDFIANEYLSKFYFNKEEKKVVHIDYLNKWNKLEYFCKCLVEARGEKFFTNWLYKFSTKEDLTHIQLDTIEMFYNYEENISEELKAKLFKNGLTWYIHDAISAEVSDYLNEHDNVKIFYDDKVLNCEGTINGYDFKVVKETKNLYHIGLELENCVASYRHKVLDLYSIIFTVIKNEKLVACIEICYGKIVQARGYHNQKLNAEISQAVQDWRDLKKIIQMEDATAEIFGNDVRKAVSAPKAVHVKHHGCDMITQEEIDALLAGIPIEYD